MKKETLDTKMAAEYLGLSESTLRQGRMNGVRKNRIPPPPFVRLGRKIIYLLPDLTAWVQKHRINLEK